MVPLDNVNNTGNCKLTYEYHSFYDASVGVNTYTYYNTLKADCYEDIFVDNVGGYVYLLVGFWMPDPEEKWDFLRCRMNVVGVNEPWELTDIVSVKLPYVQDVGATDANMFEDEIANDWYERV